MLAVVHQPRGCEEKDILFGSSDLLIHVGMTLVDPKRGSDMVGFLGFVQPGRLCQLRPAQDDLQTRAERMPAIMCDDTECYCA